MLSLQLCFVLWSKRCTALFGAIVTLCMPELFSRSPLAWQSYFITGGEHWRFWDFIYKLVNGFGYKAK